ncbi:MAG: UDP-N-acetylglucosamine 4,6-dehydratase (inverting) [Candidatus Pacebacteria bacterium]|nr:UDP-N-acetylglucosamine 4,6-dehydratase (inverting) [Candidatus Paceibacterota bacterium]MBP9842571.1 UDP-N-acetylglucosamine 4,6-dehydratase (inverting) [Candidatus Paceibacterota bacterium]
MLQGKTVLITGGTGSFGKNFSQHILDTYDIKKLIIFSRDELKQFELQKQFTDERVRFLLGDVRDLSRLQRAFQGVDIVVHAAALKQVPAMEYNPQEAVKTNIIGSQNVVDAAIDQGVQKLLLISTDKAAQPVNLYGASKLCAEKLFVASNAYSGDTRIAAVRYGNVIGSRGSIIEHLLRNRDAEEVFLTHPDMSRFWITLPQSFELVLFALSTMEGGELYVPRVPSMTVKQVFDALTPNAVQTVTGIRPGEKLHEILLTSQEARRGYDLGEYFVTLPEFTFQGRSHDKYKNMGQTLDHYFEFTSNKNDSWLTPEDLNALIKGYTIL